MMLSSMGSSTWLPALYCLHHNNDKINTIEAWRAISFSFERSKPLQLYSLQPKARLPEFSGSGRCVVFMPLTELISILVFKKIPEWLLHQTRSCIPLKRGSQLHKCVDQWARWYNCMIRVSHICLFLCLGKRAPILSECLWLCLVGNTPDLVLQVFRNLYSASVSTPTYQSCSIRISQEELWRVLMLCDSLTWHGLFSVMSIA